MVNLCIITLTTGLYLSAISKANIRFITKPQNLSSSEKWIAIPNNETEDLFQICNSASNFCVSIAKGRIYDTFEPLVLEESNGTNPNQLWLYNSTLFTLRLNKTFMYWDLVHDNGPRELIQLFPNLDLPEKIDKFEMLEC